MDAITSFLGRNGYLPHGYCFTWTPELLWSMVGADGVIAASYFSIPIAIGVFVKKRNDRSITPVAWLFCVFIFACGITHVMDVWTIWSPDYGLQTLTKVITALLSLATAIALWPLIPRALAIPRVEALRRVITDLESEVQRRKTVEEHLADVQQSLALTLASIGAGFITADRAGNVTSMNAVAESVTGWTESDARGTTVWKVFNRENRPTFFGDMNPVDFLVDQGYTVEVAHHLVAVSRDGNRTTVEVKAALTYAGDGTPNGLALVFRDLTRLAQAEDEANRLAAIVQSSNDAIIGKTLDGTITSWNRAAEAILGYTAAEAVGQPISILIPPEREHEEQRILLDVTRGVAVPAFDTVRRARDGSLVELSVSVSPVRNSLGIITGAAKIARELSSQRRAEAALAETREQGRLVKQRLEAENRQILETSRIKSQFLANMSHELRTPLNAIIGFAELLHAGTVAATSPKHREFLGHIGSSGRHLLQLINDVLDLAKVESGKFEFYPVPVDLQAVIEDTVAVLGTGLARKKIDLLVDVDPTLTDLVLDPARLKQVLFNYLSNAIKFTPERGRIEVRAEAIDDGMFRIEVEDTGIGIAEADVQKLFVEFQQLDGSFSKQHQGTGLGLALTRRLVEAQGGTVGVRSVPGAGSTFHVVLPRGSSRQEQPAMLPASQAASALVQRVLVIDGDAEQQARIVKTLNAGGFEVHVASTGADAIGHALVHDYDAIMLDLLLPDRKGLDVLGALRGKTRAAESPVISVSMPAHSGRSVGFAVADVLTKPLQDGEIVAAMRRFRQQGLGARVMVIDDDPMALDLMRASLGAIGMQPLCFQTARHALGVIDEIRPDVIVLDLVMPDMDGFATLEALSRLERWRTVPVFIWTSLMLTDEEYDLLNQSARIVLSKGGGGLMKMLEELQLQQQARAAVDQVKLP
ncbi:hypothetical protein BH09PSE5_BH09PSE5_35990 [soil metagenome]